MTSYHLPTMPVTQKGVRRRPRVMPEAPGQRQPRERDKKHLAFIACLPCVICGTMPVHAAHVRFGDPERDKPSTGMQEKPADKWAVPLCPPHHLDGPDAQHRSNEREWWARHGIDVIALCERLSEISGDIPLGSVTVRRATRLYPVREGA